MMETLAKGETHQREQVLVRKDGMLFTARISRVPAQLPAVMLLLVVAMALCWFGRGLDARPLTGLIIVVTMLAPSVAYVLYIWLSRTGYIRPAA